MRRITPAQNSAVSSAMATSMSVAPNRCRHGVAAGRLNFDGAMDIDSELPARQSVDTTSIPVRQGCKTARLHLHGGAWLAGAAAAIDAVQGFKYFDDRDLLGFVDGTENPAAQAAVAATLIADEDPAFAGGSYVIVQKYLHDLAKWDAIPVEQQEKIIGRRKLSDIELADADKPSYAHNVLTSLEENGAAVQILRDNMPFGDIGRGEFGTYFIGYARSPRPIERMLENMFVGAPPGNYDRLLDVSRAVTGSLFFAPTADFLDAADAAPASVPAAADPQLAKPQRDGSLRIGSLKDEAIL